MCRRKAGLDMICFLISALLSPQEFFIKQGDEPSTIHDFTLNSPCASKTTRIKSSSSSWLVLIDTSKAQITVLDRSDHPRKMYHARIRSCFGLIVHLAILSIRLARSRTPLRTTIFV